MQLVPRVPERVRDTSVKKAIKKYTADPELHVLTRIGHEKTDNLKPEPACPWRTTQWQIIYRKQVVVIVRHVVTSVSPDIP